MVATFGEIGRGVWQSRIAVRCALGFAIALCAPVLAAAQGPRYCGLFVDGTYIAEGELTAWQDTTSQPRLKGQPLFDPARPIRFLRKLGAVADGEPAAFVEYFGGDRFVGAVTGFTDSEASFYRRTQSEMFVTPAVDVTLPELPRAPEIRVATRGVKRIVWQRKFEAPRYVPATLYYRDGRELAFRRVRFSPRGVLVLIDSGPVEVAIDEIAELHMPAVDSWEVYFEQLAALGMSEGRLVRIETEDGLRITTSIPRFRSRSFGDGNDPNNWYRLVQPVWCQVPLAVAQKRIHTMHWTVVNEVPISIIEPVEVVHKPLIGGEWPARRDRSVRDHFLATGNRESAWGIGMHANCRMTFELPAAAKVFKASVGLDKSVGRGGCARAAVYVDSVGAAPLWRSGHVIGSQTRVDTGALEVPATTGNKPRRLILIADAAHDDRPATADPFDIRDLVDWCEPVLELDPAALSAAVAARGAALVPAWDGWTVKVDGDLLALADRWNERPKDREENRWRYISEVIGDRQIKLTRSLLIEPEHRYLMLCVEQADGDGKGNPVTVSIDGKPYATFEIPALAWNGSSPSPRLVTVEALRGRDVTIEIVQSAATAKHRVAWWQIALVREPTNTQWTVLVPRAAMSAEGAQLSTLPDNSILASGKLADRDVYTVEAETKLRGITGVRIETLLDETLPIGGPGRANEGRFQLSEFRLSARATNAEASAGESVPIASASADYHQMEQGPQHAIDGKTATGWSPGMGSAKYHAIVFALGADPALADGTRLRFILEQQAGQRQTLGRFRISVTTDPLPSEAEQMGRRIALLAEKETDAAKAVRTLYEDDEKFAASLFARAGKASHETGDRFTGSASLRLSVGTAESPTLPQWKMPIRANPGANEFRYLRYAWRKRGGMGAVLQLADNGDWRSQRAGTARELRYVGGKVEGVAGAITVQPTMSDEWTVVTRDLFADFGPITLTGMRLVCPDGEFLLLDSVRLARRLEDFEAVPRR